MGGAVSTPEVPGGGTEGYHVLKVAPNSPGEAAGLEEFFDYVLAINGHRVDQNSDVLRTECQNNVDKVVKLTVYSAKEMSVRTVDLTPTLSWGGSGLLGVSIRYASFDGASEHIWHILDVAPSSPAADAGFIPQTDYIVAADALLDDRDDLFAVIERDIGKELSFYVYNAVSDRCRKVTVIPNDKWGGEGSLGCGIGHGYLHRIPPREDRLRLQNADLGSQHVIQMDGADQPSRPVPAPIAPPAMPPPGSLPVAAAVPTHILSPGRGSDAFADAAKDTASPAQPLPSPPMPVPTQPDYLSARVDAGPPPQATPMAVATAPPPATIYAPPTGYTAPPPNDQSPGSVPQAPAVSVQASPLVSSAAAPLSASPVVQVAQPPSGELRSSSDLLLQPIPTLTTTVPATLTPGYAASSPSAGQPPAMVNYTPLEFTSQQANPVPGPEATAATAGSLST